MTVKPRKRYKLTPEAKLRDRKKYRKEKVQTFTLTGHITLRALEFFEGDAKHLPVVNLITSETEILPVFRLQQLAQLLNTSYQTLWRWTSETQQLPEPVLLDNTTGREYPVYHLEEARVIITVIGEHLCRFAYYRKDHEAPKRALTEQLNALRAQNFHTTGESQHGNSQKGQVARKNKVRPRIRRRAKRG